MVMPEENDTNGPIRRCMQFIKNNKFAILYIASAAFILFVVPAFIYFGYKKESGSENGDSAGYSHAHHGKPIIGGNALLINQDACDDCITCAADITLDYIPYDELVCDTYDRYIRNGSCYFCNDTCLSAYNIRDIGEKKRNIHCKSTKPVEIDCCLVAEIKNLEKPVTNGRYMCYGQSIHEQYNHSGIQPLWHCQSGRKGEQCKDRNTEPFICKCFKYNYQFYNQHTLLMCNSETSTLRSSECYMYIIIHGDKHNCYCSKINGTGNINADSCESLHTGVYGNSEANSQASSSGATDGADGGGGASLLAAFCTSAILLIYINDLFREED